MFVYFHELNYTIKDAVETAFELCTPVDGARVTHITMPCDGGDMIFTRSVSAYDYKFVQFQKLLRKLVDETKILESTDLRTDDLRGVLKPYTINVSYTIGIDRGGELTICDKVPSALLPKKLLMKLNGLAPLKTNKTLEISTGQHRLFIIGGKIRDCVDDECYATCEQYKIRNCDRIRFDLLRYVLEGSYLEDFTTSFSALSYVKDLLSDLRLKYES